MGGPVTLLLDTHTLLWWWTDDERLSLRTRALIADESNEVLVSAASASQIATKRRIGKLEKVSEATSRFVELVAADGFIPLPITQIHSLRAGGYPVEHRDPFDRMLAAQSELESLVLVTRDRAFEVFGTETAW
jgi:PIN domain nuclease of toxin-antitoxin system